MPCRSTAHVNHVNHVTLCKSRTPEHASMLMVRQKESGQMQLGRRTGPGARRRWSVVYTSDSQGLRRTVLWGVVSRAKRGKEGEREEALTAHCRVAKAQEAGSCRRGSPEDPRSVDPSLFVRIHLFRRLRKESHGACARGISGPGTGSFPGGSNRAGSQPPYSLCVRIAAGL